MPFHDSLYRLVQVGSELGVQLVQLTQPKAGNVYLAKPVEFDPDGAVITADERIFSVTNLAEPADAPGTVPAGTNAVALDVEGRWVIFVRLAPSAVFPAKIIASAGGSLYTVREQIPSGPGSFADKSAIEITACNLAEISLGPGAAVNVNAIVMVHRVAQDSVVRYYFDHPAYAKYLD